MEPTRLDLRLPIGLMFTILGALLSAFGALSDRTLYAQSLGINVNLIWGLVLMAFGSACLWLTWRKNAKAPLASSAGGSTAAARGSARSPRA